MFKLTTLSLIPLITTCLAQNTAWVGCFPSDIGGLSGVSVSSSNTGSPAGCAEECRNLPASGFSPTTYAFWTPYFQLDVEIPTFCLCTNNPPPNDYYSYTVPPNDCSNAEDYVATLDDTPVEFLGCFATYYEDTTFAYEAEVATYPECFQACSQYRYIAIDHTSFNGRVTCRCSPFMFWDPNDALFCYFNDHQIYENAVPQPSGSFNKRRLSAPNA